MYTTPSPVMSRCKQASGFFLHCANIIKKSTYTIANKFGNIKNYSYLCTKKR